MHPTGSSSRSPSKHSPSGLSTPEGAKPARRSPTMDTIEETTSAGQELQGNLRLSPPPVDSLDMPKPLKLSPPMETFHEESSPESDAEVLRSLSTQFYRSLSFRTHGGLSGCLQTALQERADKFGLVTHGTGGRKLGKGRCNSGVPAMVGRTGVRDVKRYQSDQCPTRKYSADVEEEDPNKSPADMAAPYKILSFSTHGGLQGCLQKALVARGSRSYREHPVTILEEDTSVSPCARSCMGDDYGKEERKKALEEEEGEVDW